MFPGDEIKWQDCQLLARLLCQELPKDEMTALIAYLARGFFCPLNFWLRGEMDGIDTAWNLPINEFIKIATKLQALTLAALSHIPHFAGVAYRATHLPPQVLQSWSATRTFCDPGFMSATKIAGRAEQFFALSESINTKLGTTDRVPVLMKIESTSARTVWEFFEQRLTTELSEHPLVVDLLNHLTPDELLFPSKSYFKVIKLQKIHKVFHVHLREHAA